MAKTKRSRYTNDDVPVREIKNGYIILTNGLKVTGVKIMPRNIFIMDQQTQDSIISNLRTVYNTIDYEFWIICADRPVDIHVYLSQLELLYNNVSNPIKRKLIMEDINKGNMFMNNNIVDTEYFLIFKEKNDDIIFSVTDNGNGIPKEDIPHLFKRFSQGTSKKRSTGTGLGLYLSRQIIEAHNGKIWVESKLDRGSEFSFLLTDVVTTEKERQEVVNG